MKRRIFVIFIALLSVVLLLASCSGGNGGEDNSTVRIMVPQKTGFTVTSQNPLDGAPGSDVTFDITIKNGYGFVSTSVGEYDQQTGKLTVKNVTRNTTVDFKVESLGFDTTVEYNYRFIASDKDVSNLSNGIYNAGTLISVSAKEQSRIFVTAFRSLLRK